MLSAERIWTQLFAHMQCCSRADLPLCSPSLCGATSPPASWVQCLLSLHSYVTLIWGPGRPEPAPVWQVCHVRPNQAPTSTPPKPNSVWPIGHEGFLNQRNLEPGSRQPTPGKGTYQYAIPEWSWASWRLWKSSSSCYWTSSNNSLVMFCPQWQVSTSCFSEVNGNFHEH